jgi:hypothetical protein
MFKRVNVALLLAVFAVLAGVSAASAGVVTLSERDAGGAVEVVQIDDVTGEVSVYMDGDLVETRPATDRELAALQRRQAKEQAESRIESLKTSVADLKGRPIVSIDARLDRLEAIVLELAAQIGVE